MRKVLLMFALAVCALVRIHAISVDSLRTCDLLFVVNTQGNAITASTQTAYGLPIDHVGVAIVEGRGVSVCEAIPEEGVTRTPLCRFLGRAVGADGRARVLVGRVSDVDTAQSLARLNAIHAPYDSLYLPGLEAVYCSELVQVAMVDADGREVFPTIPMSFHDASGQILPYWTAFYARHGMAVPEGLPGTNPAQLSRDKRVTLLGMLDVTAYMIETETTKQPEYETSTRK